MMLVQMRDSFLVKRKMSIKRIIIIMSTIAIIRNKIHIVEVEADNEHDHDQTVEVNINVQFKSI